MVKQTKSKKPIGKGKVTPVQIAFIVDRYLSDYSFIQTRSTFRTEASNLISKSPVNEAPKSLLSLGDMLDEYICLKEQKVMLNQEKSRLEQEKIRVQNLLKGMQDVMNSYNASMAAPMASAPVTASLPVYNTPTMMSTSRSLENTNYSTPTTTQLATKRKRGSKDVSVSCPSLAVERSCVQPSVKLLKSSSTVKTLFPLVNNEETSLQITPPPLPVQGLSVAKRLFNPGPQTPSPSVDNKQTSPSTNKKTLSTPQITSTNRTVITSKTVQVSPIKQVSYYSIESNHCSLSPNKRFSKRDHVKGRLDFDGLESTFVNSEKLTSNENTMSSSEDDAFDFDLPNFDCLGADFNLTELLNDFDLGGFCQTDNGSSPESLLGA